MQNISLIVDTRRGLLHTEFCSIIYVVRLGIYFDDLLRYLFTTNLQQSQLRNNDWNKNCCYHKLESSVGYIDSRTCYRRDQVVLIG
jgi:hypothetical protein